MFKLESYITPWIMGYIDKYVKLRHEDFQLSLWGGDAVLNKLDLRLDAIEHAIPLPITFKSGFIHELRIHVPWTKLGSESVVITINTIECVLKLKDAGADDNSSTSGGLKKSATQPKLQSSSSRARLKREADEDLPPGYLQALINRIVNNANIVINNLILKFVEDDIVLSLNAKSAEIFSVNHLWTRAFIELTQPELVLRRMMNFHDLTVCLDRRNASGKIETYQDPILYRCSLSCRMHMTYDNVHSKMPSATKFNVMCNQLDLSLTDSQVPMFFRLIELCTAIYYGTLDLSSEANSAPPEEATIQHEALSTDVDTGTLQEEPGADDQGWASWAWSYVPPILSTGEDDELEASGSKKIPEPPVLAIGMYCANASIAFKLTEIIKEGQFHSTHKVTFKPCMTWEAEGIGVDILMKGLHFFDVQFGITTTKIQYQGEAICGVADIDDIKQDPYFLQTGQMHTTGLHYLTDSLFDQSSRENSSERAGYIFDADDHNSKYTESYGLQKYGCFWFDYLYTMDVPENESMSGSRSSAASQSEDSSSFANECSVLRFLIGPFNLIVNSSMVQRLHKFIYCIGNHNYDPYSKPRPERPLKARESPSEEEISRAESHTPTRTYQVTFVKPMIYLYANNLPQYDVTKKKIVHNKRSKKSRDREKTETKRYPGLTTTLPVLQLKVERLDFQTVTAMYPRRVVSMVSQMAAPSSSLLHYCHAHLHIKVFGCELSLTSVDETKKHSHIQHIIQPTSGAFYKKTLLLHKFWKNALQSKVEMQLELPQFGLNLTKAQLLLLTHIGHSWFDLQPDPDKLYQLSLMDDVFHNQEHPHAVLECVIGNIQAKYCKTEVVHALSALVSSVQIMIIQSSNVRQASFTPILYGPLDTTPLHSTDFFSKDGAIVSEPPLDVITITAQIPRDPNMPQAPTALFVDTRGIVGSLDPVFCDWLAYSPKVTNQNIPKPEPEKQDHILDTSIANITSPIPDKSGSHGSKSDLNYSASQDRTASYTQSQTLTKSAPTSSHKTKTAPEEKKPRQTWGEQFAYLYPYVKMLTIQVDVENVVLFLPSSHISPQEPNVNIPQVMNTLYTNKSLGDTIVVCIPGLKVYSSGHTGIEPAQEIPIRALEHSMAGEKLPWTVNISNGSVYTLHNSSQAHYLLKPTTINATLAVTTKYNPPASDNISSLGLCVHSDMQSIDCRLSKQQLQLCYDLSLLYLSSATKLAGSYQTIVEVCHAPATPAGTASGMVKDVTGLPPQGNASNSSQVEQLDTFVTSVTETTESLYSKDLAPPVEIESCDVKLSLWLQWTLIKSSVKIYGHVPGAGKDMCMCITVDDVMTSLDIQDVFSKATCKIGAFSVMHHTRSNALSAWTPGSFGGIIVSTSDHITKDVHIIANKSANQKQAPDDLADDKNSKPSDKTNFLTATLTRVLKRNLKSKLDVSANDVELPIGVVHNKNEDKWSCINEICVTVKPFDILMNCLVFRDLLQVLNLDFHRTTHTKPSSPKLKSQPRKLPLLPLLTANNLPLIYIEANSCRLFIPECKDTDLVIDLEHFSKTAGTNHKSTTRKPQTSSSQNVFVFLVRAFSVQPYADNPLPRIIIDKELYRRALNAGITHRRGADIEDRQYQMDITGLSMATGVWGDLIKDAPTEDRVIIQHPALEWNNMVNLDKDDEVSAKLSPLAASVDLRVVAAPAVVYHDVKNKQTKVVCGYSLEINGTSDMEFYLCTNQIHLVQRILTTNVQPLLTNIAKMSAVPDKVSREVDEAMRDLDEEESRTRSDRQTESDVDLDNVMGVKTSFGSFTPFDVLLTARKCAFMVYKHKTVKEEEVKVSKAKTKGDLEWKGHDPEAQIMSPSTSLGSRLDDCQTDSGVSDIYTSSSAHVPVAMVTRAEPLLYACFSQPHTLVSCLADNQKVELSCYDILLKGSQKGYVVSDPCRVVPDPSDFSVHWLETRPGKPDTKTGIPPSLYTLRISDFLSEKGYVYLSVERPLKLNACLDIIDQVKLFTEEIVDTPDTLGTQADDRHATQGERKQTVPDTPRADAPPAISPLPGFLQWVEEAHLNTQQIVVAMETAGDKPVARVQGSVTSLQASVRLANVTEEDKPCEMSFNGDVQDILVRTTHSGKSRPLIGPFTLNLDSTSTWCKHSGPAYLPRITLLLELTHVQLNFGQDHYLCFERVSEDVLHYLKINSQMPLEEKNYSAATLENSERKLSTQKSTNDKAVCKSDANEDAIVSDATTDDLRSGKLNYHTKKVEWLSLPSPGEITFGSDYDTGRAALTWSYHEPRIVTQLMVTPVPFNLPQEMDVRFIDQHLKVPCALQYWNPVTHQYETYAEFSISENPCESVSLPEVTSQWSDDVSVSQIWRIFILHPRDKDEMSDLMYGLDTKHFEPLINPMTLALSTRVDSCFSRHRVPILQASVAASSAQLKLYHHTNTTGGITPHKLSPFQLTTDRDLDEEIVIVDIDNPSLGLSNIMGKHQKVAVQVSSSLTCDIVEYRNMTLQPLLENLVLQSDFVWEVKSEGHQRVKGEGYIEPVTLRVNQAAVHTITTGLSAWPKPNPEVSAPVLPHYIICNDTQERVWLGQHSTDEWIHVDSHTALPYSWRSHKIKLQCLRFGMENQCLVTSECIDVDTVGTHVVTLKDNNKKTTLVIKVKQLTSVQKQIIICGLIKVCSRIHEQVEVKLLTNSVPKCTTVSVLGPKTSLPSYIVEHEELPIIKLRLCGGQASWSQDIPVSGSKMKESRLIKLPLSDRVNFQHIWCQIFCQQLQGQATCNTIVLAPVFITRSHLPAPLLANIETTRSKVTQQVEVQGQGYETQMTSMAGDVTYNVTFQLGAGVAPSSPSISVSSGMIEQIQGEQMQQPDVDIIVSQWEDDMQMEWPYNTKSDVKSMKPLPHTTMQETPSPKPKPKMHKSRVTEEVKMPQKLLPAKSSEVPEKSSVSSPLPNIDLRISLQQKWAGFNSLLIDVSPHWLIVNECGTDVVVVEGGGATWKIDSSESFAPPEVQSSFRLAFPADSNTMQSEPIVLSEEDNTERFLPIIKGVLYMEAVIPVDIHISNGDDIKKVCCLTLQSTKKNGIRVVTIRERYAVTNFTDHHLDMLCLTVPLTQKKHQLFYNDLALASLQRQNKKNEYNPLLTWNEVVCTDDNSGLEFDEIHYLSFSLHQSQSSAGNVNQSENSLQMEDNFDSLDWSYPVRLKTAEEGSRQNIGLPVIGDTYRTLPLTVSSYKHNGVTYIVVSEEKLPNIVLHNNCRFSLHFGQTLMDSNILTDTDIYEETELVRHLPCLPALSCAHYALPTVNTQFPQLSAKKDTRPRLHLAGCEGLDALWSTRSGKKCDVEILPPCHSGVLQWSGGIDLHNEYDIFVTIPGMSDVKVHIEKVAHSTHVFVDPVSRAEISAKEIRSRIKGKEKTVVIENKHAPEKPETERQRSPGFEDILHKQLPLERLDVKNIEAKRIKDSGIQNVEFEVNVLCRQLSLVLEGESGENNSALSEVIRFTLDNVFIGYSPQLDVNKLAVLNKRSYQHLVVCVKDLQVDNQLHGKGNYHFPVVLVKQEGAVQQNELNEDFMKISLEEKLEFIESCSMIVMRCDICSDLSSKQTAVKSLDVALKPVSVFVEDTFIYDLLKQIDKCVPVPLTVPMRTVDKTTRTLPSAVIYAVSNLNHPIRLEQLTIQPIKLLMSVHASLALFISSDNTPLSFSKFEESIIFTSSPHLVKTLTMYYAVGTLVRAGLVVGSLDILGSPTGFVRSVSAGVSDLFRMPYEGLTRGPGAFLSGVSMGLGSLVKHMSSGTIKSITNFASSVSRNMDRLSLDKDHLSRQEETRRHMPSGLSEGLKNGLSGFGLSLLGAIAGIADQPLKVFTAPSGNKASGLVSGVGKGLVGAVTKPIGGAAELVSQTGLGVLHSAGLSSYHPRRCICEPRPRQHQNSSRTRFHCKFEQSIANGDVMMTLQAQLLKGGSTYKHVTLLLLHEIVMVIEDADDKQHLVFSIGDVECDGVDEDAGAMCIVQEQAEKKQMDEKQSTKDRIAAFVDSTTKGAIGYLTDSQSDSSSKARAGHVRHEFHVEPKYRDYFVCLFGMAKRRVLREGFHE